VVLNEEQKKVLSFWGETGHNILNTNHTKKWNRKTKLKNLLN
jgi:hypothetical protein